MCQYLHPPSFILFTGKQNLIHIENKIRNIGGLATTAAFNKKTGEGENKIPNTSGIAITALFNTKTDEAENKYSDVSGLVKQTDHDAKILNTENKYFTISDYNNLKVKHIVLR